MTGSASVAPSTPTAQATSLGATPASAAPSDPGPVSDQGAPRAAVVPAPPPAASAVASFSSWRAGGGLDRVNALASDFGAISAAGAADVGAREAACTALTNDAAAGKAYAPMPDARTKVTWADALRQSGQAAATCLSAGRSGDAAQQSNAATQISTADATFTTVTEQLAYFSPQLTRQRYVAGSAA